MSEINTLVNWLRSSDCKLQANSWYGCAMGKLFDICGLPDHGAGQDLERHQILKRLGINMQVYSQIMNLNDDTTDPLKVADYIERELLTQ